MKPYARMGIMLVCMISTALILQGLFDTSDHAKSERIVRHYRGGAEGPGAPPSLEERLEREAPGGVWSSEITAGCRGFVRVSYAAPGGVYLFDYDVPEHAIHPGNPSAERVLAALAIAPPSSARGARTVDGGASSPAAR